LVPDHQDLLLTAANSRDSPAGSHIWFQVGSVDEAKAALQRGAQALVVQGSEAGGHNRAPAATFSLLPAVIDAVPSVPVVAASVEDTARHLIFGPEFPDASTRGLRNRIVREWQRRDDPPPYKAVPDSETAGGWSGPSLWTRISHEAVLRISANPRVCR
jgi:hypothetical protein